MGYVYGYLNNNPEEGYVTCPLTRRTNVRKYKTGKTKNYNERLDTEFSETRAEFTPKPEDIVLFQTDDEDGTKAENRIHLIFYEFAKELKVETLSTFGKKNSRKEIVYLTDIQIERMWKTLEEDKQLNLKKIILNKIPTKSAMAKEQIAELWSNLPNYTENKFILGHNLKCAKESNIHSRVNNIVESQLPLSDLLKKGKTFLIWRNKDIGKHDRKDKPNSNYTQSDLEYDLKCGYIDIDPPICLD